MFYQDDSLVWISLDDSGYGIITRAVPVDEYVWRVPSP